MVPSVPEMKFMYSSCPMIWKRNCTAVPRLYPGAGLIVLVVQTIFYYMPCMAASYPPMPTAGPLIPGYYNNQARPDFNPSPVIIFAPGIQNLFSTHFTDFSGGNFYAAYEMTPNFCMGMGLESAASKLHFDNGWKLTGLRFHPVFLNFKLDLFKTGKIIPYLDSSPGISFNKYDKGLPNSPGRTLDISERGLYIYSGAGIYFKVSRYFIPILDAGFKGYHMSFNNLDINPHGFDLKLGILYSIPVGN